MFTRAILTVQYKRLKDNFITWCNNKVKHNADGYGCRQDRGITKDSRKSCEQAVDSLRTLKTIILQHTKGRNTPGEMQLC